MKRWIWITLGAVLLAGLWYYGETRPLRVDTARIGRGPIRAFVEEEGKTRVIDRFVVSAPVAGRLRRVDLDEGDPVTRGTVVAEIDPLPLRTRIQVTEARIASLRRRVEGVERKKPKREELERANVEEKRAREGMAIAGRARADAAAEHAQTQNDYRRQRSLLRAGAGSAEAVERAKTAETGARARLDAADVLIRIRKLERDTAILSTSILRARMHDYDWEKRDYEAQIGGLAATRNELDDDLRRTHVKTPATGVILRILRESEQWVTAGTPLLEIGNVAELEVEADFLSGDAARMSTDMTAEVFGRGLGATIVGAKVKRVYPSAFRKVSSLGVEQQRVKVLLTFPGPPLGDRFRVNVRVILDERADVILVPEGALFRQGTKWHVFRIEEGRARPTAVKTGLRDGRFREVVAGLKAGDHVILHPDRDLKNGTRVGPID